MSPSIISIQNLSKTYKSGHQALKNVSLDIHEGEILALLGPNGAGKTTLISIICGIVKATGGSVLVGGFDNVKNYREARKLIGLVPQELTLGVFDVLLPSVRLSRGLHGEKPDPDFLEKLLKDLSLWDKKDSQLRELSGGMKRRVLIAKALSHDPKILFLDEPTSGVDVELRKSMWDIVKRLRQEGVTIILTTHYIEEAEAIANRIGIINQGELVVIQEKDALMKKLGKQHLLFELREPLSAIPSGLSEFSLELSDDHQRLTYAYNAGENVNPILEAVIKENISLKQVLSKQTSLEEIFVDLINNSK